MTATKQRGPMNDSDRLDEILVERLSHQFDMSHKTVRALLKAAAYPDLAALADRYRKDAELYQWWRENYGAVGPVYVTRRGYRSTAPGAVLEEWDEIVGYHANGEGEYPTLDAAIGAARSKT